MDEDIKTGPRDVFTHLLAIIFLYTGVITAGSLLFGYIDIYFPDPLSGDIGRWAREGLRWPLAVFTIIFPLYVWLSAYLQKDIERHPPKRDLKTRKWLLYFTLFLTVIAIVIDIVTLLYNFLQGELTVRFFLKVASVLVIAVSVFAYYAWNLRSTISATRHPKMKFFAWTVVSLTAVIIVAGFVIAGSPQSERLVRFDDQRLSDLQTIQSEVVQYWQAKETIPSSLDSLKNEIRGFTPPVDPETGTAYEYRVTGNMSFELCATFKTSNKNESGTFGQTRPVAVPHGIADNWQHNAERTCFSRTIDPDLFPPFKKIK